MLLHVVGGDEVAADIADLLELLFLVSALVDEVHVLHVHLLLLEHLLARVEAAHVVAPRIPEHEGGFHEDSCFKLDSGLNWVCGYTGTVKAGNFVTFFAQINFFLKNALR